MVRLFISSHVVEDIEKRTDTLPVDAKMDKIGQLAFHPCARNLLLSCSDDHGNPTLRLWDTETGAVLNRVYLPKGGVSFPPFSARFLTLLTLYT